MTLWQDRPYFFDDGLLFECTQCGACCTGAPGTIYVGPEEMDLIANHLNLTTDKLISKYLYPYKGSYSIREDQKGWCYFYKNQCTIYGVRPIQCRTFPFWFSNLRSETRWMRIQRQCPGIGHGRRYTKDEIIASALQTIHL